MTGLGAAVARSPRLAEVEEEVTVVLTVKELSEVCGSEVADDTETVLRKVALPVGAVTTTFTTDAAPEASAAFEHETVPDAFAHVQPVPEALTKETPAGSTSCITTDVAGSGPSLLTLTV